MKSILILSIFLLTGGITTYAQNDADVLRYGMLNYGSTARSLGMGNSFSALGADASTMAINPAGIALYRRSEFTFTPAFTNRNTDSDFGGTVNNDNHFKFAINNFAFVFAGEKPRTNSDWKHITFGVAYNRTNNFSTNSYASYDNKNNTLIDSYLETLESNNVDPADIPGSYPFDINLAWQTYLIDRDTSTGNYFSAIPFSGTKQTKSTETRGGQGEWDFSVGANHDDRLYFGATLGIPVVRYEERSSWSEVDVKDTIPFFKSYTINSAYTTSGSGINLKAGMIYRATDFLRLGISIHTPTWLFLTDDYSTDISTDLEDGIRREEKSPDFIPFQYHITTPFRVITSIAFIAGHAAAFNFDYEFLDYSQSKITPDDPQFKSDFAPTNRALKGKYGMSHNLRAGIELPYQALRYRLGMAYSTSPFDKNLRPADQNYDQSYYTFTGGIGYRTDKFFIDIAYAYSQTGMYSSAYTMNNEDVPSIKTKVTDNRVLITGGWLF